MKSGESTLQLLTLLGEIVLIMIPFLVLMWFAEQYDWWGKFKDRLWHCQRRFAKKRPTKYRPRRGL